VSNGFDDGGVSLEQNLERLARVPLSFEPGTAWSYSLATDVLGGVVARAGDAPLPEVVRRLVTGPLKLNMGFRVDDPARLVTPYVDAKPRPARMQEPQALPFAESEIVFSPARTFDRSAYPSGGAGMVGTAGDYLAFLEALRKGGAGILKPATAAAMASNQTGDLSLPLPGGIWGFGFGASVLRVPAPGRPEAAGTWQWGGVYGNHFWVDPSAKLSVVLLTNTAIAGMLGAFPDAVHDAVYGPKPVQSRGKPQGARRESPRPPNAPR
jgi:CubicO group peptidase (beta-lactamase class C family)